MNINFFLLLTIAVAFCFSYLLSTVFTIFKGTLLKIRTDAIDSERLLKIKENKVLACLLNNIDSVTWTVDFISFALTIFIGLLVYPFLIALDIPDDTFSSSYFFVGLAVFLLYYFLNEIAVNIAKIEKIVLNFNFLIKPILLISKILSPLMWIIRAISDKCFGHWWKNIPENDIRLDTSAQIRALGNPETTLTPELLKIIQNTIRLPELDVTDVLLPRNQIIYLDSRKSPQENIDEARKSGHTRLPFCDGDIDKCSGIIHIKDLFQFQGNLDSLELEKFQYPLITFSEDTSLADALKKLLKFRIHMAFVVNEFDSVLGLLTLEDILEELVGNIQDEFDEEESPIVPIARNAFKILGSAQIHDVEEALNIQLDVPNVSTFGGLITSKLGRIPQKNERVHILGLNIKITDVNEKLVLSTTVRATSPESSN